MRFQTSNGGFITADNMDAAIALAAQFGMGDIVGSVDEPKKQPAKIRSGKFAAWDNLTQSAAVIGSIWSAASACYSDHNLDVVFFGNGKPEKLNPAEKSAVRNAMRSAE